MKFIYTNYKGETQERDVDVLSIDYLTNPQFGYAPGWFLTGRDRQRNGDIRSFRMDERMTPLPSDLAEQQSKGLSSMAYPFHENHDVRDAVRNIEKRVTDELEEARSHHMGGDE